MKYTTSKNETNNKLLIEEARKAAENKIITLGFSDVNSSISKHLINNALAPMTLAIDLDGLENMLHKMISNEKNDMTYLRKMAYVDGKNISFAEAMEMIFEQTPNEANSSLAQMGFGFKPDVVTTEKEIIQALKNTAINAILPKLQNGKTGFTR